MATKRTKKSPKTPQESLAAHLVRTEPAMDAWAREKAAYDRFDNAVAAIETACDGLKGWVARLRANYPEEKGAAAMAVEVQHGVADWFIRLGLAELSLLAADVDAAARKTRAAEERVEEAKR
jgi:hypothetical protein